MSDTTAEGAAAPPEAPGYRAYRNQDGSRRAYWVCRADLAARGFAPKTVRLNYNFDDPKGVDAAALRCQFLQQQMLAWAKGRDSSCAVWDGTLRALINKYLTDPKSPYHHNIKPVTQRSYAKICGLLLARVGSMQVDALNGADVVDWYREWRKPEQEGAPERTGSAHLKVSILKIVLSYGATLGKDFAACGGLRTALSCARFEKGGRRTSQFTFAHLVAFRAVAHARGLHSMALGLTLQFSCALRQSDVIGQWDKGRWHDGLTWAHIGADGVIRKTTNKTTAPASHRIADYPDLVAELALVTPGRTALVVSEETGRPYTPDQYRRVYKRLAALAGIPAGVWNMDARAGAITESYEAGAVLGDVMALATHTSPTISRGYNRSAVEQSSRVAKLRVNGRTK